MADGHTAVGRGFHSANGFVRIVSRGCRIRRSKQDVILFLPRHDGEIIRPQYRSRINAAGKIFLRLGLETAGDVVGDLASQIDVEICGIDSLVFIQCHPLSIKIHHAVALVAQNGAADQFFPGIHYQRGSAYPPTRKAVIVFLIFGGAGDRNQRVFLVHVPQNELIAGFPHVLPAFSAKDRAFCLHLLLTLGQAAQRIQGILHGIGVVLDCIAHLPAGVGKLDRIADRVKMIIDPAVLLAGLIRRNLLLPLIIERMPAGRIGKGQRNVHLGARALIPFAAFLRRNAGGVGNGHAVEIIILNHRRVVRFDRCGEVRGASGHVSGQIEQQNAIEEAQRNAPLAVHDDRRRLRPDQAGIVHVRMGEDALPGVACGGETELTVNLFQLIRGDIIAHYAAGGHLLGGFFHRDQLPFAIDQRIALHGRSIRRRSRIVRKRLHRAE